jgi:hypothetical protein
MSSYTDELNSIRHELMELPESRLKRSGLAAVRAGVTASKEGNHDRALGKVGEAHECMRLGRRAARVRRRKRLAPSRDMV